MANNLLLVRIATTNTKRDVGIEITVILRVSIRKFDLVCLNIQKKLLH